MKKKFLITLFLLISVLSVIFVYINCFSNTNKIGLTGYVRDEAGNLLNDVKITHKREKLSIKTDALGNYDLNTSRTLYISFEKEGYKTLHTHIKNFSETGYYNFDTITLKKDEFATYKDISRITDPSVKQYNISGTVLDVFNKPLKNVTLTLKDTLISKSYNRTYHKDDKKGVFEIRSFYNYIALEKEGFIKQILKQYCSVEKQKLILLKPEDKEGVYLVKNGKYIQLPEIDLEYTSERLTGTKLWGFGRRFSYEVSKFYFPEKTSTFRIESDSIMRFIIFDKDYSSKLLTPNIEDQYLCTANYKSRTTPYPSTSGELVSSKMVYPSGYYFKCYGCNTYTNNPTVIDFTPSNQNLNYIFINTKTKKGVHFNN